MKRQSVRIFESPDNNAGYRKLQVKFHRNGSVKLRVVGKGSMFTWNHHATLMPGETPEQWLSRNDKENWAERSDTADRS